MPPPNLDDLIRRYQAGESAAKLGRELGVKGDTVATWLRKAGVKMRGTAEANRIAFLPADATADLIRRYTAGESEKKLSDSLGISRSAVRSRLKAAGVPVRSHSDAERLKWSGMGRAARKRQVAAAHTARRGQKDSIEVQMRRAATWQAKMSHRGPGEVALAAALTSIGVRVTPQKAVGPYNLDLAMDELPVAVEVECGNVFKPLRIPKTLKRLKYIVDQGWRVLIVFTKNRPLTFPAVVQQSLAFREVAGRDEPALGQYGVVDGDGKPVSIPGCDFHGLARIPGF